MRDYLTQETVHKYEEKEARDQWLMTGSTKEKGTKGWDLTWQIANYEVVKHKAHKK